MSEAKHLDTGKPPIALVPRSLVVAVAEVMGYGQKKYPEPKHNWRYGTAWSRFYSSAMRHLLAWNEGETLDPESGLSHLAHAACNIAFLLEWAETHPENDDRWKGANHVE